MHGGAGDSGALGGNSPGEAAAGRGISGEEELTSRLQAAAFSFTAAGMVKNQRFPPARVELSVTKSLPVAGEFGVEMRASRLVSEPQAMASHPVVAELEVDQWPVRRAIQFQGAAFPGAAVGSEPHSSALSRVRLSWRGCAIGHVYVDTERPHNIHANEAGRRLQAHNDNEAGPTTSFAPLYVQVLSLAGNL